MSDYGIVRSRGPWARMNWDSPASVSELDSQRPSRRRTITRVVVRGCGCATWLSVGDTDNPANIVRDIPGGSWWEGARWVDVAMRDDRTLVADGRPLPSWQDCTHG